MSCGFESSPAEESHRVSRVSSQAISLTAGGLEVRWNDMCPATSGGVRAGYARGPTPPPGSAT
jgi:hypothetical protein